MCAQNFYKIRDPKTGLFRNGGMFGRWNKRGKEWSSLGHVKQHLDQFPGKKIDWENWELVEYVYTPMETGRKPLIDLL